MAAEGFLDRVQDCGDPIRVQKSSADYVFAGLEKQQLGFGESNSVWLIRSVRSGYSLDKHSLLKCYSHRDREVGDLSRDDVLKLTRDYYGEHKERHDVEKRMMEEVLPEEDRAEKPKKKQKTKERTLPTQKLQEMKDANVELKNRVSELENALCKMRDELSEEKQKVARLEGEMKGSRNDQKTAERMKDIFLSRMEEEAQLHRKKPMKNKGAKRRKSDKSKESSCESDERESEASEERD